MRRLGWHEKLGVRFCAAGWKAAFRASDVFGVEVVLSWLESMRYVFMETCAVCCSLVAGKHCCAQLRWLTTHSRYLGSMLV